MSLQSIQRHEMEKECVKQVKCLEEKDRKNFIKIKQRSREIMDKMENSNLSK